MLSAVIYQVKNEGKMSGDDFMLLRSLALRYVCYPKIFISIFRLAGAQVPQPVSNHERQGSAGRGNVFIFD